MEIMTPDEIDSELLDYAAADVFPAPHHTERFECTRFGCGSYTASVFCSTRCADQAPYLLDPETMPTESGCSHYNRDTGEGCAQVAVGNDLCRAHQPAGDMSVTTVAGWLAGGDMVNRVLAYNRRVHHLSELWRNSTSDRPPTMREMADAERSQGPPADMVVIDDPIQWGTPLPAPYLSAAMGPDVAQRLADDILERLAENARIPSAIIDPPQAPARRLEYGPPDWVDEMAEASRAYGGPCGSTAEVHPTFDEDTHEVVGGEPETYHGTSMLYARGCRCTLCAGAQRLRDQDEVALTWQRLHQGVPSQESTTERDPT